MVESRRSIRNRNHKRRGDHLYDFYDSEHFLDSDDELHVANKRQCDFMLVFSRRQTHTKGTHPSHGGGGWHHRGKITGCAGCQLTIQPNVSTRVVHRYTYIHFENIAVMLKMFCNAILYKSSPDRLLSIIYIKQTSIDTTQTQNATKAISTMLQLNTIPTLRLLHWLVDRFPDGALASLPEGRDGKPPKLFASHYSCIRGRPKYCEGSIVRGSASCMQQKWVFSMDPVALRHFEHVELPRMRNCASSLRHLLWNFRSMSQSLGDSCPQHVTVIG